MFNKEQTAQLKTLGLDTLCKTEYEPVYNRLEQERGFTNKDIIDLIEKGCPSYNSMIAKTIYWIFSPDSKTGRSPIEIILKIFDKKDLDLIISKNNWHKVIPSLYEIALYMDNGEFQQYAVLFDFSRADFIKIVQSQEQGMHLLVDLIKPLDEQSFYRKINKIKTISKLQFLKDFGITKDNLIKFLTNKMLLDNLNFILLDLNRNINDEELVKIAAGEFSLQFKQLKFLHQFGFTLEDLIQILTTKPNAHINLKELLLLVEDIDIVKYLKDDSSRMKIFNSFCKQLDYASNDTRRITSLKRSLINSLKL